MSHSEAKERIDKFIKDLDNRDIVLIPEKLHAKWGFETTGLFGKKSFETIGSLGDMLSKWLALYQQGKDSTDVMIRMEVIDQALRFINKAHTEGAVKPSDGIYRKYEESQDEIAKLKKEMEAKQDELQETSSQLLECEAERRSLQHQLDKMVEKFGQPN